MQGHDLLTRSSLGFLCLAQGHFYMLSEGENWESTTTTGRAAARPEILSSPHTSNRLPQETEYGCWMGSIKNIGRQPLSCIFFQALWVFTNCRKNILYVLGWHMEHCLRVVGMFLRSFSSYITTVLWIILKDNMYILYRKSYSCSYFYYDFSAASTLLSDRLIHPWKTEMFLNLFLQFVQNDNINSIFF